MQEFVYRGKRECRIGTTRVLPGDHWWFAMPPDGTWQVVADTAAHAEPVASEEPASRPTPVPASHRPRKPAAETAE